MSSASSGAQAQARHHGHVLHLQFVAVVGAPAVLQVENEGQALLRVILGADVLLLVRAVGTRALAGVVNPANQIIVIRLLAHASEICGETCRPASDRLRRWSGRRGSRAFRTVPCRGRRCRASAWAGRSVKPDCQRYAEIALICWSVRRKFGILVVGRKSRGLFQPHRNPIPVQLEPDIFQVRPDLLHVLHQAVRAGSRAAAMRPSILLLATLQCRRRVVQPLASSLLAAVSACFIR